jgi:hypothetical protein
LTDPFDRATSLTADEGRDNTTASASVMRTSDEVSLETATDTVSSTVSSTNAPQ